jgi:hypothetical protein
MIKEIIETPTASNPHIPGTCPPAPSSLSASFDEEWREAKLEAELEAICRSLQQWKRRLREEENYPSYDTEDPYESESRDEDMEHSREMIIKLQGRVDSRLPPR